MRARKRCKQVAVQDALRQYRVSERKAFGKGANLSSEDYARRALRRAPRGT